MNAETKLTLDIVAAGGCSTPGCTHEDHGTMFLHGRCHPNAGTEVSYTRGTGILKVACLKCQKPIALIKVADQ